MKLVKAYKNPEFLLSLEARTVRILCEYLEPERRFRHLGVRNAVIFFGSARLKREARLDACYYSMAADLAERLARWTLEEHALPERYYICTGGGPGIMQAAHEGAARVDAALNIGLNISLPFEQFVNEHLHLERALEFHYFFMRKFWFVNLARGAVIFPGGFGTMDELFELLTLTQTGKSSPMPIVLFDKAFWSKTVNFAKLAEMNLISEADLHLFHICESVDEAFEHLKAELRPKPLPEA
jgi:uncharacterized protein (TIGR00730 family)